jgi:glycosyltransferase involved in cell wall biosynthesis
LKAAFLFHRLYDSEGKQVLIGGIETYIQHLMALAAGMGIQPIMFQPARVAFERPLGEATVFGVAVQNHSFDRQKQLLYEEALRHTEERDLIVFGADHYSVPTNRKRAISIQHGIDWDLPAGPLRRLPWLAPEYRLQRQQQRHIRRVLGYFDNCMNRVCVDHNFPNWYRATRRGNIRGNVWVIPNCCSPAARVRVARAEEDVTRVLFARRFEIYRGTRLMADAVAQILGRRSDIQFTFAGDGPDARYLTERFQGAPQVRFTRYLPGESVEIHLQHDLAVIPSLGSEGTSLSAAEAMGAGCAVIATPVGGITNMILDGFNGLLAQPRPEEFAAAIVRLADDKALRREIAEHAYCTALRCFDLRVWQERWKNVFEHVAAL